MSDYGARVAAYELPDAVVAALEEYVKGHRDQVAEMVGKAARKCRATLKATSPRGNEAKHYADGWTVRAEGDAYTKTFTVYNKTKPGLAHLLNDGHAAENQYGTYGFVPGDKHIDKAANEAVDYLIEQLKGAGAL